MSDQPPEADKEPDKEPADDAVAVDAEGAVNDTMAEHAEVHEVANDAVEENVQVHDNANDAVADNAQAQAQELAGESFQEDAEEQARFFRRYIRVGCLGSGSSGTVNEAIDTLTQEHVAIKMIPIHNEEGVQATAMREVSLLMEARHPNILRLLTVHHCTDYLFIVLELLDGDLSSYMKEHGKFADPGMLRKMSVQAFRGVQWMHTHGILHRDLKPQNLLIDVTGRILKLADFGLARPFSVPVRPYTREVVTLWYRAIEVLLGQQKYCTPIDMWSLGCIMAEMGTATPLFCGNCEIDTIFKIFQVLGTPTEQTWPGITSLSFFKRSFPQWRGTGLATLCHQGPGFGDEGIALLRECLCYGHASRPTASRCLQHPFFQ
eukprot:NODE_7347_length_1587_cov_18.776027.p1 GENE.NODE_7347_length_1587_cov_18.776027~~NODE_7347_length_1587_cov_18.776027.p1  ORF type:complete len:377 (-),score=94.27 NODE_7347_length_1587_cov_18.776027:336-1466(-)